MSGGGSSADPEQRRVRYWIGVSDLHGGVQIGLRAIFPGDATPTYRPLRLGDDIVYEVDAAVWRQWNSGDDVEWDPIDEVDPEVT